MYNEDYASAYTSTIKMIEKGLRELGLVGHAAGDGGGEKRR